MNRPLELTIIFIKSLKGGTKAWFDLSLRKLSTKRSLARHVLELVSRVV